MLVDILPPELVSTAPSKIGRSSTGPEGPGQTPLPACNNPEVCILEFTILEHSEFIVSGDFLNDPMLVDLGSGQWKVSIPMTPENILPNSGTSINLTIESQSGHTYSFGTPYEWAEVGGLVIRTSTSECLEGLNFIGSWSEGDMVCLYDHNELESGRIQLDRK